MLSEKQFLEILHREQNQLYGIALSIMKSEADAWDVLQWTVEQAWKKRATLRGGVVAFPAWIKRILVNRCLNLLKARQYVVVVEPHVLNTFQRDDPREQDAWMIWHLVNSLDEDHRRVVVLRYLGDLSLNEISSELGIPLGTVKSRLHIALQRLKQMWLEQGKKGVLPSDTVTG